MNNEPQPIPPENVRVVLADGATIPVECVYRGRKSCGCACWVAVTVVDLGDDHTGAHIEADMLPANTEVAIAARWRVSP